MKEIDVSIIIVNYNTGEFLRECLSSVYNFVSKKVAYEVIVVDNASTDNSVEIVKKDFPQVLLLTSTLNIGFSRGNNVGIKRAKGKYILFLNPDTVMQKDTLEKMIAFMDEHENAGASTCYLEMPNGKLDDASHRGFPTPWNAFCYFSGLAKLFPGSMFFNGYNLGWRNLGKTHEIDALAGAFMLVRAEAGEEAGWWDETFFFYGEDLDFCYRLKEKGWKIYFVPTVSVLHHKGVSGGIRKESQHVTTADRETRIRATDARFDAMKIFYRKHYANKYPVLLTRFVLWGINLKRKRALSSL